MKEIHCLMLDGAGLVCVLSRLFVLSIVLSINIKAPGHTESESFNYKCARSLVLAFILHPLVEVHGSAQKYKISLQFRLHTQIQQHT